MCSSGFRWTAENPTAFTANQKRPFIFGAEWHAGDAHLLTGADLCTQPARQALRQQRKTVTWHLMCRGFVQSKYRSITTEMIKKHNDNTRWTSMPQRRRGYLRQIDGLLWPWPLIKPGHQYRQVVIACKFHRDCSSRSWDIVVTRSVVKLRKKQWGDDTETSTPCITCGSTIAVGGGNPPVPPVIQQWTRSFWIKKRKDVRTA